MALRDQLDRLWYPGFADNWDNHLFREETLKLLRPGMRMLDLGAGRGALPMLNFQGQGVEVWGADIDPVVAENPYLDCAFVTRPGDLTGVPDASVDVMTCCSVLEHVSEPAALLAEVRRVLKPGGVFLAKTPNRFHYMPVIASITPLWFHKIFNRWRGREEVDTFPTLYRLNSRGAARRHAGTAGLEPEQLWTVEGRPEYLRMTPPTYLVGLIYERMVNGLKLEDLKGVLFMRLRRPAET
jgi:ubiquinone/menaquinone biosynthesis C-methylase UbiE